MNRPPAVAANPSRSATATLAERYCTATGCKPAHFRWRIFWLTLHRPALPLAPLLLFGNHFKADWELIEACGRATRLAQVHEEIGDHPTHPRNRGWLRRRAKFRISLHRLTRIAQAYLPAPAAPTDARRAGNFLSH